ncbi:hypothetical protein BCR37DRAFT_386970 [Protomyces lactucae-debilis]|uniref:C2H2-type domain-containing protein n=1 Tax=Protomyces lactucae-debilis TaxID=2754530 RepID=A0A1Y2FGN8_PROLT|nr:uncharacterized protein BCR37DRAFT_386970 [Protomyces lactucae-debilis]ORY83089.1 hypothetical protein BCR37DRAFT_386970 [Protomyces lactucae-debilis]
MSEATEGESPAAPVESPTPAQIEDSEEANSLQCDDCGKKLRNAQAAQVHAETTQHVNFSESTETIKPLTEEEKAAKLQMLKERLAAKRAKQAEEELEQGKKNAAIERKKTQESAEAIEQLKRKEELNAIAAKKREKQEDLKAKQRVKEQIEADKRERAERSAREKAQRAGQAVPVAAAPVAAPKTSSEPVAYTTARLQIRAAGLPKPIIKTFPKSVSLLDVAIDLADNEAGLASLDPSAATFKMFGQVIRCADLNKSLEELKLVPSASLMLS